MRTTAVFVLCAGLSVECEQPPTEKAPPELRDALVDVGAARNCAEVCALVRMKIELLATYANIAGYGAASAAAGPLKAEFKKRMEGVSVVGQFDANKMDTQVEALYQAAPEIPTQEGDEPRVHVRNVLQAFDQQYKDDLARCLPCDGKLPPKAAKLLGLEEPAKRRGPRVADLFQSTFWKSFVELAAEEGGREGVEPEKLPCVPQVCAAAKALDAVRVLFYSGEFHKVPRAWSAVARAAPWLKTAAADPERPTDEEVDALGKEFETRAEPGRCKEECDAEDRRLHLAEEEAAARKRSEHDPEALKAAGPWLGYVHW